MKAVENTALSIPGNFDPFRSAEGSISYAKGHCLKQSRRRMDENRPSSPFLTESK